MDISSLREREINKPLSVSELNNFIKNLIDTNRTLAAISVSGEISNFTDHKSGHLYFSLKDSDAQIKAVMFRSQRARLKFKVEDGMRVTVHGSVSVYSQNGSVQIYVNSMEPDGIGALYLAYEQLKDKLMKEGLFDEEHKRSLPPFPQKIGVITSPTGAAVRDIINVTKRRYKLSEIYLYPSLVQGDGAEENLIKALEYFEKTKLVDVIIIGRGGGSIEDLWAFNSEKLARTIFSSSTPIISAVGHETDFTICDFVSDMRAPTPSAAAEIAVPDLRELFVRLSDYEQWLSSALVRTVERKREHLDSICDRDIFSHPENMFKPRFDKLTEKYESAVFYLKNKLSSMSYDLAVLSGKTEALSPLSVLSRGYVICEDSNGNVAKTKNINVGDSVNLIFSDGSAKADITEIKRRRGKRSEKKY